MQAGQKQTAQISQWTWLVVFQTALQVTFFSLSQVVTGTKLSDSRLQ